MIKCMLFDADGVVINAEMFSLQYEKKFGVSNDEMIPFFKGEFQDCLCGRADLAKVVKPWLSKWKWQGSVEEFLDFWFKSEHNVDERIIEVIKKLRKKGIKCYLATNQEKYRVKYMKENMGFDVFFDDVFSSAHIGHKKPERDFYECILKKFKKEHILPNEVLFFDDSQDHIAEAKKVGIDAHHYTTFEEFLHVVEPLLK